MQIAIVDAQGLPQDLPSLRLPAGDVASADVVLSLAPSGTAASLATAMAGGASPRTTTTASVAEDAPLEVILFYLGSAVLRAQLHGAKSPTAAGEWLDEMRAVLAGESAAVDAVLALHAAKALGLSDLDVDARAELLVTRQALQDGLGDADDAVKTLVAFSLAHSSARREDWVFVRDFLASVEGMEAEKTIVASTLVLRDSMDDLAAVEAAVEKVMALPQSADRITFLMVAMRRLGREGAVGALRLGWLERLVKEPAMWNNAFAFLLLGQAAEKAGDEERAASLYEQGAARARSMGDLREVRLLGSLANLRRNPKDDVELLRKAFAMVQRYALPTANDFMATGSNLASSYKEAGQLADAEAINREMLALVEQQDPVPYHMAVGIRVNMAQHLIHQERYAEAEEIIARAVSIGEEHIPDHGFTSAAQRLQDSLETGKERVVSLDEAVEMLTAPLEELRREAHDFGRHRELYNGIIQVANKMAGVMGQVVPAGLIHVANLFAEAVQVGERVWCADGGVGSGELSEILYRLAQANRLLGNMDKAMALVERARTMALASVAADHVIVGVINTEFATCLLLRNVDRSPDVYARIRALSAEAVAILETDAQFSSSAVLLSARSMVDCGRA